MPAFYTRKGDDGSTGLLGEGRVAKYDLRMEVLGALDEATAALGVARAAASQESSRDVLLKIQRTLYQVMTEAAATPENAARFHVVDAAAVVWLEQQVDDLSQKVTLPRDFIVPGDSLPGAYLDLARTIVRRAERRMAELQVRGDAQNPQLLGYLNRLSSFLFILEVYENQVGGVNRPTLAKSNT